MKFVCLLPIRDEADIIAECLSSLLIWADEIYIFDTGSVDNTWEIVRGFAAREKRVVALRKEAVFFSEHLLRGWMFNCARASIKDGDWFLRCDADEFHHVPPPVFVRDHMLRHETLAYHQYYDFRFTESEVRSWETGRESLSDRSQPIQQRRRYFTISRYAEPRLCRYRSTMQWPESVSFPFNAGFVAKERLPIRHYPHRDPVQMGRRSRLRAAMMSDPLHDGRSFNHWKHSDWTDFVVRDDLPGLRYWKPETELPMVQQLNHLKPAIPRLMQRLAHSALLPLLDRTRPVFSSTAKPEPLPAELIEELNAGL